MRDLWALVPFFWVPTDKDFARKFESLNDTIRILRRHAQRVVVVDDGAGLTCRGPKLADHIVSINRNQGKTNAVRSGLAVILKAALPGATIVQCDADHDQDPADVTLLLEAAAQIDHGNHERFLVIGDRYPPHLTDIPLYRRHLLLFQTAIASSLGYVARDIVSGFRLYSLAYARCFQSHSTAQGYGLEAEQLVIAKLCAASVTATHLTYSRPREAYTASAKWLDNLCGILQHDRALRSVGCSALCDCLKEISNRIQARDDKFVVSLAQLGVGYVLQLERTDDAYTISAAVPSLRGPTGTS